MEVRIGADRLQCMLQDDDDDDGCDDGCDDGGGDGDESML